MELRKNKYKRMLSALLGIPLTVVILLTQNPYIIDIAFTVIAIICLHEFYKAFSEKYKPIKWVGYLSTIIIAILHLIYDGSLLNGIIIAIFISILLMFIQVFRKKADIIDVAITLLGICYITIFVLFVPLTVELLNGTILIWYIFVIIWGTDVFAYLIGKSVGKHHFTDISPKKTVEGSIGGLVGGVLLALLMTYIINTWFNMSISYITITVISIVFPFASTELT